VTRGYRIQVREYIDFIRAFTENADIMSKSFFIVVPYTPTLMTQKTGGLFEKLPFGKRKPVNAGEARLSFEENRTQLQQRVSVVEQGMVRTGVRVVELKTEETIELYYRLFNPGELEKPVPFEH